MKCLIINAAAENKIESLKIPESHPDKITETDIFNVNKYKIGNCIGCTNCWLKTPGICCVKDDWEVLFTKFLKSDLIIFISDARLGFISYKLKNIIDRLIPLALPYTIIRKGEMRHPPRYKKNWKIGLLYAGDGNKDFLNTWLDRFALNLSGKSLGAYNFEESGELYNEINAI